MKNFANIIVKLIGIAGLFLVIFFFIGSLFISDYYFIIYSGVSIIGLFLLLVVINLLEKYFYLSLPNLDDSKRFLRFLLKYVFQVSAYSVLAFHFIFYLQTSDSAHIYCFGTTICIIVLIRIYEIINRIFFPIAGVDYK